MGNVILAPSPNIAICERWENVTLFVKPEERDISHRKLEALTRLGDIRNYYLRNPVKGLEDLFGIVLFDAQAYAVASSWTPPHVLWVDTRGYGKTTIFAAMTMLKGMLINNFHAYIASGSASQSIESFMRLEQLATKAIASMTGLTNVFAQEVVAKAGGTGFVHNPAGHYYHLYNNAMTKTLNSNVDKNRGKRAHCVIFDECGFLPADLMRVYEAFCIVDKSLKLGGNIDAMSIATLPENIANQLFYVSSASTVDTEFYKLFRDFSKRMIAGDPNYFVADIDCEVMFKPLLHGKVYPVSTLTKEQVEGAMRTDPERGAREFYNKFIREGGAGQIIKRALITRNSTIYPPVLSNPDGKRHYVLFYDPARTRDNSVVLVCEVISDAKNGIRLKVVNLVNFADTTLKKRTPKTTQEQISLLKEMIVSYNGDVADFNNIDVLMVDAGSGGGGNRIPDFLWENWTDSRGVEHVGLIDREYSAEYTRLYPSAKNILKMVNPSLKPEMFEALIRMVESDLIMFPDVYDNKGYLTMMDVDKKMIDKATSRIRAKLDKLGLSEDEYNLRLNEELEELDSVKTKMYQLSPEEEIALVQIDAMKTEIVNICRTKRDNGRDAFRLPPHKDATSGASEGALNDDRAYVLAMAGYWLAERRRGEQIARAKRKKSDSSDDIKRLLHVRAPKKVGAFTR